MRSKLQSILRPTGAYALLLLDVAKDILRNGVNRKELVRQLVRIGSSSVLIVLLMAVFTGMVLAIQTAYGLQRFGAKNYVGNIVGLSVLRELGPALTAIMLCGRVGAGIASEIASMVSSEQVDAMRALGANPITKLVTPRIVAALIALPALTILANVVGMYGGMIVAVYELNINVHTFIQGLKYTLVMRDLIDGLLKSCVFGLLLVSIACFKGLRTKGGTEGVGMSTTSAVVTSSIAVIISDFFLTKFLLMFS